jgi:hypothetical protein
MNVQSLVSRFLPCTIGKKKVLATPCLIWNGKRNKAGYGLIFAFGVTLKAHRVAYELRYGVIPDGHFVYHKCLRPRCVNPEHLYTEPGRNNRYFYRS